MLHGARGDTEHLTHVHSAFSFFHVVDLCLQLIQILLQLIVMVQESVTFRYNVSFFGVVDTQVLDIFYQTLVSLK